MNTWRTSTGIALLTIGLISTSGIAQAALVNFTLTGEVDAAADANNSFGLNMNDTITVSGSFDDSVLSAGTGTVSFSQGSGNSMTLEVGNFTFTEMDDTGYTGSYPQLELISNAFESFDYETVFSSGSYFLSQGFVFDGEDDQLRLVSGSWTGFVMQPVPLPAGVWLLASGLLGLVVSARRRQVPSSTN